MGAKRAIGPLRFCGVRKLRLEAHDATGGHHPKGPRHVGRALPAIAIRSSVHPPRYDGRMTSPALSILETRSHLQPDGIHYTEAGHAMIARLLVDEVAAALRD